MVLRSGDERELLDVYSGARGHFFFFPPLHWVAATRFEGKPYFGGSFGVCFKKRGFLIWGRGIERILEEWSAIALFYAQLHWASTQL